VHHPNRRAFEGVLTLIDVASDKAPSGARGHRVILTRDAAEMALPGLIGMAVGYKAGWDGHNARQKCGVIEAAEIVGRELRVEGYLFARDFPEVVEVVGRRGPCELGMSYELADARVGDMRAKIWTLTQAWFTGAAILRREKAAYRGTWFRLAPGQEPAIAAAVEPGLVLRSVPEDGFEEQGEEEAWRDGAD
jgi:hypothetical protein